MNYNGPGNTNELNSTLVTAWQTSLNQFFEGGKNVAAKEVSPPQSKVWMFNPLTKDLSTATIADIRWNSFPKRLLDTFPSKTTAWRFGDSSRNYQEEYCEWEVVRDTNNKIKRVTFTTEVPEYYDFLAQNDSNLLLSIYRKHISQNVQLSDIIQGGAYKIQNKWNYPEIVGQRGVLMHMGFGPNTLQAAINLSAEATWPSVDKSGNLITDEQGLIDCRLFGARERHSDPHIGAQINSLTRAGNIISFAGPTGLYIDSVDFSRFETPDGTNPESIMKIIRGDTHNMMRVIFEVPNSSGFELSEVKIDGTPITFGGQIAEAITIRIRGLAISTGDIPPNINCQGSGGGINNSFPFSPITMNGTRKQFETFVLSDELKST